MTEPTEYVRVIHERQDGEPLRPKGSREVTVPVIYTLADGREVRSNHTRLTRTEAADLVAQLPRTVDLSFHKRDVERAIEEAQIDSAGTGS